jgi:hypothetical protein
MIQTLIPCYAKPIQTQESKPMPKCSSCRSPALLAGTMAALLGQADARAASMTASTQEPTALIIADLAQCGRGEYVLFTVLWQGVVGVASEPWLIGWNKPQVGDRLTGPFLEKGWMEATQVENGATSYLDILETGVPIAEQNRLRQTYCQNR